MSNFLFVSFLFKVVSAEIFFDQKFSIMSERPNFFSSKEVTKTPATAQLWVEAKKKEFCREVV